MVRLHIKKGDESQFLFETTVQANIEDLMKEIVALYNGRLKVSRICCEMGELADHGVTLPPNMQGMTEEQIVDLKLVDEWGDRCQPSGGHIESKDDIGRRNGQAPTEKLAEVIRKTVKEAKDMISKKKAECNECLTLPNVKEAVDILRGAVMIVYPMELPPHDPIRLEFENNEDLSGTQAALEVIEEANAALWWAGKEFMRGKKLVDFVGKNEKTKVICKLQKRGQGAPAREPVVSPEEQKAMMAFAYKKQEELKKLNQDGEDAYLNSQWSDDQSLKRQFHGLSNIHYGPGRPL